MKLLRSVVIPVKEGSCSTQHVAQTWPTVRAHHLYLPIQFSSAPSRNLEDWASVNDELVNWSHILVASWLIAVFRVKG